MLKSDDARVRESALRTLTASVRIRGEREIVGAIRSAMITNPIGKKHRSKQSLEIDTADLSDGEADELLNLVNNADIASLAT